MGYWRDNTKPVVEDKLGIDVRVWARKDLLEPGCLITTSWRDGNSISARVEDSQCELVYTLNNKPMRQTVPLDHTTCNYGGQRAWFKCPGCNRRCAKLHSGNSGFYCRICYRLPYYSQECGEIDCLIHKKDKIKRRWEKPRIRKATKSRLYWQWVELEMLIDDMIEARLGQWWNIKQR